MKTPALLPQSTAIMAKQTAIKQKPTEQLVVREEFTFVCFASTNADSNKGSTNRRETGQYDTSVEVISTGCLRRCSKAQALPLDHRPAHNADTAAGITRRVWPQVYHKPKWLRLRYV